MNTVISGIDVSPVNMEDRKNLGLRAGDTVKVHLKIEDKGKIRTQVFEGIVLARKHGSEPGATFTVRKVVDGIGVEKIFPLYSPNIDKIEIVRRSTVRRAKIYYIREKVAREIRRQMRRMRLMNVSSESDIEAKTAGDGANEETETGKDVKADDIKTDASKTKEADEAPTEEIKKEETISEQEKKDAAEILPSPDEDPNPLEEPEPDTLEFVDGEKEKKEASPQEEKVEEKKE